MLHLFSRVIVATSGPFVRNYVQNLFVPGFVGGFCEAGIG